MGLFLVKMTNIVKSAQMSLASFFLTPGFQIGLILNFSNFARNLILIWAFRKKKKSIYLDRRVSQTVSLKINHKSAYVDKKK